MTKRTTDHRMLNPCDGCYWKIELEETEQARRRAYESNGQLSAQLAAEISRRVAAEAEVAKLMIAKLRSVAEVILDETRAP